MFLSTLVPLAPSTRWVLLSVSSALEVLMLLCLLLPLYRRQRALAARLPDALLSQLRARLSRLEELSYLDPLTALRSGLAFRSELGELCRQGRPLALLYIDLDDFGQLNEQGHRDCGDAALVLVAQALRKALRRQSDRLYRLHGDEFVAVLPSADSRLLEQTAHRMLAEVAALRFRGRALSATIAGATSELLPWAELERAADQACQAQKKRGKGRYVLATAAAGPDPEPPSAASGGGASEVIEKERTGPKAAPRVLWLAARTVQP
jgi:diguanylate cyclase (GGDEF)-like protein